MTTHTFRDTNIGTQQATNQAPNPCYGADDITLHQCRELMQCACQTHTVVAHTELAVQLWCTGGAAYVVDGLPWLLIRIVDG